MEKIKVIIADDSDFVRDGMKIILSVDEEFEVLGCAANGKEAIELGKKKHRMFFNGYPDAGNGRDCGNEIYRGA